MRLILLLFLHVLFICTSNEVTIYTPDTYPDSLKEFTSCGLKQPGFVCDPDGLLNPGKDGTNGVELLDKALQYIRSHTACICDQDKPKNTQNAQSGPVGHPAPFGQGVWMEQCEKAPNQHGFTLSVAVLGKMEVTDDQRRRYRGSAHLPAIFAAELKNRLNRGQCNDDALIVLAVNDSSIRTSTGGVAATKLSPQFIINSSHIAQKFFARRDFTSGLLHMVDQFTTKLGAAPRPKEEPSWFDVHFWPLFPQAWRESNWRWQILIGLLLLIILLVALMVFLVQRRKGQAGYTPGQESGRSTELH